MGIDLWVRRGAAGAAPPADARCDAEVGPESVRSASVAEQQAPQPRAEAGRDVAAPQLALACLHGGGVALIGGLASQAERRLGQDVLRACRAARARAVDGWPGELATTWFRWPQTARGERGHQACRAAFRAFLHGVVERHAVEWLLLAGLEPWLWREDGVEATAPWAWGELAGARRLSLVALGELRHDPVSKVRLWQSVAKEVCGPSSR